MKYRFKILEEFEKEFKKTSSGSYQAGDNTFTISMNHLFGVEIPDEAAKEILNTNVSIFLNLADLVPGKNNCWYFTKEMITPVEEPEQPGKFYPFAEEMEMLVWDTDEFKAVKRTVFGRKDGKFLAWSFKDSYFSIPWNNAKPLPKTITVTMQEIAEWKGVDVEQIKVEG